MLRRSYAEADCLIGTAPYVRELLGDITLRRFEVMTDTGVPAMPEPVDRAGRDGPVRLLFVGRLVRTKGVLEAIRAMALLRDLPATLDIVGQGVEAPACEALVAELGLADRVRLHGHRSREEVMDFYRAADVFFFPSYREPGGLVVAEAMSYGLPCIVNDLGGPGTTVDDDSGIRVHAIDESRYVQDLAAAARTLVADKQQRLRLGSGARARVADVGLWSRKLQRMTQIYQDILEDAGR
jgi:glycosyltransferase involved in cell wall biosynthesis